ncbi:MFS-type transporter clz9-like [Helicoverpa zea]|uniref:MFS-type transporter clz9-like n=1 Tax=Helicoverpa zea TaxID=7113 RepID=UPI001F5A334E|nr:MFS-type transporter clz9-like [Helicoverpa zea]XP_047027898.1 MFS-type transporter clz9-like [Helicoverpa zea]XP_047034333.1 MFS-type transporter clz9-like [Helicoverpa zea]
MPRNYKRTTDRQEWDPDSMKKAVQAVFDGTMGYLKASKTFEVPKSTLQDRVNRFRQNNDLDCSTRKGLGRFKPIFSISQEQSLVEHVLIMERRLFGLTYKDLRRLAYQFAESNSIDHCFNKDYKLAGEDWLAGFMKRHPELSLRAAEPTSVARAMGFNMVSVNRFFDLLEEVIDQHKFLPTNIYNVDETGLTTVPKRQSRIIALKGRKQVGLASSAERGQLTTAVLCVSASGNYVPPLLIFPRVRMKAELLDGAPPGTVSVCHPSGWIQSDIFVEWLNHFISSVKPKKEDPVLLLLDGHSTHTKNLPLIEKARDNGVVILSFPPHCTHRLQPLDVSIMGPLSAYYTQEVNSWLRNNPGRVVTQFQLARLFGAAYCKAATIQNAVSGFSKTGIFPTNRTVFGEADFAAAETTEIPSTTPSTSADPYVNPTPSTSFAPIVHSSIPSTSPLLIDPPPLSNNTPPVPTTLKNQNRVTMSPADIMPVPKISAVRKRATDHRRGKTAIITSSPYKNELMTISQTKTPKLNLNQPPKTKKPKPNIINDNICLYCLEEYGSSRLDEGWVRCRECEGWAHEGCTGYDSANLDNFVCMGCVASR